MTFHFCGYFPKKATPRPEGYDLPGVIDIASVSNCIADGPEDWIKSWTFNELGFFDDVDTAESLVPGPKGRSSRFMPTSYSTSASTEASPNLGPYPRWLASLQSETSSRSDST